MCLGSTKKLMKIEPNLLNKLDLSKVQRAPGSLFFVPLWYKCKACQSLPVCKTENKCKLSANLSNYSK